LASKGVMLLWSSIVGWLRAWFIALGLAPNRHLQHTGFNYDTVDFLMSRPVGRIMTVMVP